MAYKQVILFTNKNVYESHFGYRAKSTKKKKASLPEVGPFLKEFNYAGYGFGDCTHYLCNN